MFDKETSKNLANQFESMNINSSSNQVDSDPFDMA